jgi:orotate phosphoribosyltransferase
MTPADVRRHFEETGALLSGHFRLSSGLHSDRYLQCAKVLMWPGRAEALGHALAGLLRPFGAVAVVSPALGGVVIGQEVGRSLGIRALFTERVEGAFTLRRGFAVEPGEKVVVVEDVVTTGKSTREVLEVVKAAGAAVVACGAIVDRRALAVGGVDRRAVGEKGSSVDGIPFRALLALDVPAWEAAACPLCGKGEPLTAPGSRHLAAPR